MVSKHLDAGHPPVAEDQNAEEEIREAFKNKSWTKVVALLEPVSPTDMRPQWVAWLTAALRNLGRFDESEQVVAQARQRTPNNVIIDLEWARNAHVAENWEESVARHDWFLANHDDSSRPGVHSRLTAAHRQLGAWEMAETAIARGLVSSPNNVSLQLEAAQLSMKQGDWPEALDRLDPIRNQKGDRPPRVEVNRAIVLQKLGEPDKADSVIADARRKYPDNLMIEQEWAFLPDKRGDRVQAIRRLHAVEARQGAQTPIRVFQRLAKAHRSEHEFRRAEATIKRARAIHGDHIDLDLEWSQLAVAQADWELVIERTEALLSRHDSVPANIYGRLAGAYRRNDQLDRAVDAIERGRSALPENTSMASTWAQFAMVADDWPAAIERWQVLADLSARNNGRVALPLQAGDLEWNSEHWLRLAREWPEPDALGFEPNAGLFAAIADVLLRLDAGDEASEVIERGLSLHPNDGALRCTDLFQKIAHADAAPGEPIDLDALVGDWPFAECNVLDEVDQIRSSLSVGANHAARTETGLPELRMLRVALRSTAELAIRAGRFFDATTCAAAIRNQSERELWREIPEGSKPLEADARQVAREFGERFESPDLPAELLAEALFRIVYAEMCDFVPMQRLAASIAEQAGDEPVFVEVEQQRISYLNSFTATEIGQLYLYFELRARGVNVYLCRFVLMREPGPPPPDPTAFPPLWVDPSRVLLRGRPTNKELENETRSVAVVPGGIRSLNQVLERLPHPMVYATGYIIQEFAYDRTTTSTVDLVGAFLPERSLLPVKRIELKRAKDIPSSDLLGVHPFPPAGLGVSEPLGGDWIDHLGEALVPAFESMMELATEEVREHGIAEAHVADNLYAESAIFAEAVRRADGSIVLWPHSANPVDVDTRGDATFKRVHAVTAAGCEAWSSAFPDVEVVHSAELMLKRPERQPLDPSGPLSVVILGGKNILGAMPFVHQTEHEEAYRAFLEGLAELRKDHRIDVYYKPKGKTGETEAWLERCAGKTADWTPVFEHPLRLDLPNMVFVSMSVGSTALLEGIGRGVPGMIVTDARASDYTTIGADAIPADNGHEILKVIRNCATPEGFEQVIANQQAYYAAQTGFTTI